MISYLFRQKWPFSLNRRELTECSIVARKTDDPLTFCECHDRDPRGISKLDAISGALYNYREPPDCSWKWDFSHLMSYSVNPPVLQNYFCTQQLS
jgi:hypothetical protein